MLSEQVLISHQPVSVSTPTSNASSITQSDSTITLYDLHSSNSIVSYKRTSTASRCLAVTPTHILAGQEDKAVVNIYNRTREGGALETTVPFQEKWTVLVPSVAGHLVAGGTESGRVGVWELCSGRLIYTGKIHLQKVTTISFNHSDQFLITGSADTNVFVWSLPLFLDLGNAKSGQQLQNLKPERVLGHHQREITDALCGKGRGPANILVTASRDLTIAIWNYHDGTLLRRFILNVVPSCLAMDPADRGIYVGLEDGSVLCIDFHGAMGNSEHQIFVQDNRKRDVPITVEGLSRRWFAPGHDSPVACIGVMSTGDYVVTGSQNGQVCVWDVAAGGLYRKIPTSGKGPISNLKILPLVFNDSPTGLRTPILTATTTQETILKPRYEPGSTTNGDVSESDSYTISTRFLGILPETCTSPFQESVDEEDNLHDMDIIIQGAIAMSNYDVVLSTETKAQALETELAGLYEAYEGLTKLQKKTWEAYVNLAMGEKDSIPNENTE